LTFSIGIIAAITDCFAAASHQSGFLTIKWERQITDETVAEPTAYRLFEQKFVTQLSHPFFTCSFVLRPVLFLTLNAAISNGFTGGACVRFYFVDLRNAAGSANVSRLSVFAAHYFYISLFLFDVGRGFPSNKHAASKQQERIERGRKSVGCWFVFLFFRYIKVCSSLRER
jgi:hypothetical protein